MSTDTKSATPNSLLAEIFSGFGQMVWSKDIATGKVQFMTDNFSPVFEVSMDLIRMEPSVLKSCIHPEDAPFVDLYSKVLLSNNFEELEYRIITPSGKIKWICERKQLVKNHLGEIVRLDALLTETTDPKSEELRMMESEATFKSLFYRNPNPMWVYDTESLYFLAVNDAAVRFYGYTHDEFFRMTIRQIRPQEDVDDLLKAIRDNNLDARNDKTWRHLRKDGSTIHVKLVSNAVKFRGSAARLVLANDVTQQVTTENRIEKVYHHLEKFQDAVSKTSLLALLDSAGKILFVNENLAEKSGRHAGAWIGKDWSSFLAGRNKEELGEPIRKCLKHQSTWRGERKFQTKSKNPFWVRMSVVPIQDTDDDSTRFLLIGDDISELKEAEKRNRDFALKLHNILEGVTDALFVLDRKWHITNLNLEAEKLLNQKRSRLMGRNLWEILPEEESTLFYQFFRKARKQKITVQFEEYFAPKKKWFDISLYPAKDGLAVCFRDVSERRKKEEERKELMEQLITQNRDLEEFTFITSHSLRAQIANISMLCSAIDVSGMTPSNQEIFEKLFQSSANLDSVIDDLNTILTVKDRNTLLFENVQVQSSFINAVSRIPPGYSPFLKCIQSGFDPDLHLFTVRNYLETIFTQLLTNSLKFRAVDREPVIRITGEKSGKQVIIKVEDNGRGLDTEILRNKIFHLYKTFHPGVSGKGLGLYLCRILMDELHGEIEFVSMPGIGTTIQLRFPHPD